MIRNIRRPRASHTKNRANTYEDSQGWSKPPERPECHPCQEDLFPASTTNEEIAPFPRPMGRRKIRDHQRSSSTPRKIEEALGGLLWAKKIEKQSYIGGTESPVPKEGQ